MISLRPCCNLLFCLALECFATQYAHGYSYLRPNLWPLALLSCSVRNSSPRFSPSPRWETKLGNMSKWKQEGPFWSAFGLTLLKL